MQLSYFSSLLPELSTRAARATLSKLGFSNAPLRRHLLDEFAQGYGDSGCFLGDPVFEATFRWQQAHVTMAELSKTLLHPDLVAAMDKPWGESAKDYRFPREARPYTHQLEAWQALLGTAPKSVVVTSGTGSGKTECFMVPVLSRLASLRAEEGAVQGVRALFLYPLNALIQSQRERLRAWTGPFGGDVRFCLYNGMTPEEEKAEKAKNAPNEVHDRATLRDRPPAILVTNPTMLEYMLVRAQDAAILEKSKGKLEWIVLDEAHNYIGSQAAELALLLRRVLHAFGTDADKIRFVATSATMGAGDVEAKRNLQEFLARLAGVHSDRVVVVEGEREVPALLEKLAPSSSDTPPTSISRMESAQERYDALAANPVARALRELFVPAASGRSYQPLSELKSRLRADSAKSDNETALAWVDALTSGVNGTGRDASPFLPLRAHIFHNTLNGLWACSSGACVKRSGTKLDDPEWPFGMVFTDDRRRCECGAPVFPLVSCNDCNETYLEAEINSRAGRRWLLPPLPSEVDEFLLDRDPEERENEAEMDDADVGGPPTSVLRSPVLIVNVDTRGAPARLNPSSAELLDKQDEPALSIRVQDQVTVEGRLILKCPCCDGDASRLEQFRTPRIGAPFLLGNIIPTLLEFCPEGDNPLDVPMRGRRMITFTDSRQGTARIAAQLQQDSERNGLRAAVYRRIASSNAGAEESRAQIEADILALKPALGQVKGTPAEASIAKLIAQHEQTLLELSAGKPVLFNDMVGWLSTQAPDVSRWIYGFYAESDQEFKRADGKEQLARVLMCREFARRPKRQNSLETMGLVSVAYPKLSNVRTLKPAVQLAGLSLVEWKDFLKISLDFVVRQSMCLMLPSAWKRWGGNRVFAKQMLPAGSTERPNSQLTKWPRVLPGERQNKLVRILAFVLKVDPATESGRDRIDSLLIAAWEDLTLTTNLLQLGGGQGRALDIADMAFRTITDAWVCPVTRRVLDCTLRGVTPYLPQKQLHEAVALCRPVQLPVCDVAALDYANDQARVEAAREWVNAQASLTDLRVEGIWSSINDRVVEGAGYFRAAEHSAQQGGSRLQVYEAQFKRGAINLMSCSTTMEMGVDIGGLNTVAMNNVPPHPANYLQRAGRAGRRGETRSVALTVCKNNPHDQHVFLNTAWPFETKLKSPGISLSSPVLVQRHVNSMVLAQFLRQQDRKGKLDKLTLDWWMLPRGSSRQERFTAWCECFDAAKQAELDQGLRELSRRTVFEGRKSTGALVAETGRAAGEHAHAWSLEYDAIVQQLNELSKKDEEDRVPMRALTVQKTRLLDEYLLRELATSGFLPGYGFPTDITTFETLNKDSVELQKHRDGGGREDNKFHRRELPSRDTVTALREYAPGATVVIDGLVYESAGITLNWHAPASLDQVNELQNIRQAWRCKHCGASGTSVLASHLRYCTECGSDLAAGEQTGMQYLEPAGFSVDLYAETHNDITLQKYVPVEAPWIAASGDWMPLVNPALGSFRASAQASVFHHSSGLYGSGYAVCLECGRTAPMGDAQDETATPFVFRQPHKRLRGRRGQGDDWMCGGSDSAFKIKKGVRFGREYTTDVLELCLFDAEGHALIDEPVAYTLAVALRRTIAARLGIAESELGCDTKLLRDGQGRKVRAVQIFDMRAAGYSSLVAPELPALLRGAREVLVCERSCDCACQSCLLTFDTRFKAESLNRQAALEFITPKWTDALALPEELMLFGSLSQSEYQPVREAVSRELNRSNAKRLFVYVGGEIAEWDFPSSPLRRMLHWLSAKSDVELVLVVTTVGFEGLSAENASVLSSLEQLCGVRLVCGNGIALRAPGACLATVEFADGTCRSWATQRLDASLPAAGWGESGEGGVISSLTQAPRLNVDPLVLPTISAGALDSVGITNELDGTGAGFGSRFWGKMKSHLPLTKTITAITYEDRYLATPISCALLVEAISGLKAMYEPLGGWANPVVQIMTMQIEQGHVARRRNHWAGDWEDSDTRGAAVEAAFEYCGIEGRVWSKRRSDTVHGRCLTIDFEDGSVSTVWLDQGFSYWTVAQAAARSAAASFDANGPATSLGEQLAEIKTSVQGHALPTRLFFEHRAEKTGVVAA
ncbi:DEAD/DEAH box helicase [Variovorax sp. Root411]|uniref:DEAD/DEAH box helicase n=1 Tax=Variovorax sp. Root411 TaxID=1736530 RepID=UPI000A6D3A0A|nr:DEAD/DEAH box helicase [Variovorax sp. Root411]